MISRIGRLTVALALTIGTLSAAQAVTVRGTVIERAGRLDREIAIRQTGRTIYVDVPRSARVTRLGRRISVHDLQGGDGVRVTGTWSSGDRIRATRVAVYQRNTTRRARFRGRVSRSTNEVRRQIRVWNGRRHIDVGVPDNAHVTLNGRAVSIHQVPAGAQATMYGNWVHRERFTAYVLHARR
jgi:hypothetical protein